MHPMGTECYYIQSLNVEQLGISWTWDGDTASSNDEQVKSYKRVDATCTQWQLGGFGYDL